MEDRRASEVSPCPVESLLSTGQVGITVPVAVTILDQSPRNSWCPVRKHARTLADFSLDQKVPELELLLPGPDEPVCKRLQTFNIPVLK